MPVPLQKRLWGSVFGWRLFAFLLHFLPPSLLPSLLRPPHLLPLHQKETNKLRNKTGKSKPEQPEEKITLFL